MIGNTGAHGYDSFYPFPARRTVVTCRVVLECQGQCRRGCHAVQGFKYPHLHAGIAVYVSQPDFLPGIGFLAGTAHDSA